MLYSVFGVSRAVCTIPIIIIESKIGAVARKKGQSYGVFFAIVSDKRRRHIFGQNKKNDGFKKKKKPYVYVRHIKCAYT